MYSSSPGIPYGYQGDITIWAELQYTVLRLDTDPKQLDVLRRVCTHTSVLLHRGGGQIKDTIMADLKIITPNILFQLSGHNLKKYNQLFIEPIFTQVTKIKLGKSLISQNSKPKQK